MSPRAQSRDRNRIKINVTSSDSDFLSELYREGIKIDSRCFGNDI